LEAELETASTVFDDQAATSVHGSGISTILFNEYIARASGARDDRFTLSRKSMVFVEEPG
jgi:hypothetical protein